MNFINAERLLHSSKTAVACGGAYLLAVLVGQPSDQWIVISVMVVMCAQIYVGGIMHKSYLRLLGTMLGCLVATATIYFLHHSTISILASIMFAGFLFSYIATLKESYNQMGTLGAVTTVIILFGNPPTYSLALMRFFEISIGILIAALVSQFIFPIHARTHLRRAQAVTLQQIKKYYMDYVKNRTHVQNSNHSHDVDENIVKSLLIQRQLANDSSRELVGKRFDPSHFADTLYCEREILRAINFMEMALAKIAAAGLPSASPQALASFHQTVINGFDMIIHVLKSNRTDGSHVHLPAISLLSAALQPYSAELPASARVYLDGFIFAAEILITNLGDLAKLYLIPVSTEPLPLL